MRTAFKVGGTIFSALWTVVFNALTLAGIGTFLGYEIDWRWFTLAGFIAFLVFVGWWIGGLYRQLHALKANKPSIKVRPRNEFDNYYLEVKNIGNTATFQAEIEIIEGKEQYISYSFTKQYKACWETTRGRESQIIQDHTDLVRIAHFVSFPPDYQSQRLNLYFYDPTSIEESYVYCMAYLVGAKIVSENGTERPLTKPELVLQITINSEPSLKEGSFIKKYKLCLSGLEELPN
jgi:hypothetical protein